MKRLRLVAGVCVVCVGASAGWGQSLYLRAVEPEVGASGEADPLAALRESSMFFFEPPQPREFNKHDIITIIVDESSKQESSQSLDTKTETDMSGSVNALIDPIQLLELKLRSGQLSSVDLIDLTADRQYKGSGDYEREDKFSARITAEVLEIKPNGTLLLEARTYIRTDEEERTLVLSGLARPEDVTTQNTVRSSQLASLNIVRENAGQVADSARKGLITRVLDAIFAF